MSTYAFPLPGWHGDINPHGGVDNGGSDLFADRGYPIVAISGGKVSYAGLDFLGGNNVMIHGDDGLDYYYAHLNETPAVKTGDSVIVGARLGSVGNTGNASGGPTHLHIGIGYGIGTGAGPHGGVGQNFDAITFLRTIYSGGSPNVGSNPGNNSGEGIKDWPIVGGATKGATDLLGNALTAFFSQVLSAFSSMLGR